MTDAEAKLETPWTPGPWSPYFTDNAGGPYAEVRIGKHPTEGGKRQPEGDYWPVAATRDSRTYEEWDANTRLIALAPEMAEAILAATSDTNDDDAFDTGWKTLADLGMKLRAIGDDHA